MTNARPGSLAGYPAEPGEAAAGRPARRPRRYFVTEPTDPRPLRRCYSAAPARWDDETGPRDGDYCRCGGAIERTAASRSGWRHRPARRQLGARS